MALQMRLRGIIEGDDNVVRPTSGLGLRLYFTFEPCVEDRVNAPVMECGNSWIIT